MVDRLAIKRLSASDLTLFEPVFRRGTAGNQKSINLNRDVFVDGLYPALSEQATGSEIPVSLTVYGPTGSTPHKLARKIIKNPSYKNWRLNGEFIRNPEWNNGLYDILQPNDLAIMLFRGIPGPTSIDMVLVAGATSADHGLFAALSTTVASASMVAIEASDLASAIAAAGVSGAHPINALAADPEFDEALEDASQGGLSGLTRVRRRLAGRSLSPAALAAAKAKADEVGRDGEALINGFLDSLGNEGGTRSHVWVSATNAIAPYDFLCRTEGGVSGTHEWKLDVKSTRRGFAGNFHVSLAELYDAAKSTIPYHLYRVYDLSEVGGKLRTSGDIRAFAAALLNTHDEAFPAGVTADSFSIGAATDGLAWSDETQIAWPAEED